MQKRRVILRDEIESFSRALRLELHPPTPSERAADQIGMLRVHARGRPAHFGIGLSSEEGDWMLSFLSKRLGKPAQS